MPTPSDPIVDMAKRHLDRVLAESGSTLPNYGSRWQPQVDAIRRDISTLSNRATCLDYAQYNITFDGRPPFPDDKQILEFHEWAVTNEFPQYANELLQMSENPASGDIGQFNGRAVSLAMYCHARIVLAGITYANKPERIIEIGGGYGEIARLWLKNPIASARYYILVDIPECLFLAEVALRTEFGDKVGYLEDSDPGTPILLVPLQRLSTLSRPADLVVNTGSMQEMTEEWIDYYVQWLDRYDARYFYSLNYAAQPLSVMGESRNLWAQRLGPKWSTRHLRMNIPLMDLVGPTRDFLECLFEKKPATRGLAEWSVFRGSILSKTTYVEGLDLLRQSLTVENARTFVDLVLRQLPYHPKEILYLVRWLIGHGVSEYAPIGQTLEAELGGELVPVPPPPILPLLTSDFFYEGQGETAAIIPLDKKVITRAHGAAIMHIAPGLHHSLTQLRFNVELNCYSATRNIAVLAAFEDGKDFPIALVSKTLLPGVPTILDEEFDVEIDTADRPAFEIRVGVASPGTLLLNHRSNTDTNSPMVSSIRVRAKERVF